MDEKKFDSLNLSLEVIKAISDMGFEELSPIQQQAIPLIMDKKDVIGQAQTGTGKTAAFGIPVIEIVDSSLKKLQAMILCPTRELSIQVAEEISNLAKYKEELIAMPIYGGQPIERQIKGLKKGVQVVIGTPGRVIDHIKRKTLKTDNIKMFVLDEADEMFDMGFREDIETIIEFIPKERQTAFFSATMEKEIMDFAKKYQNNPQLVKVVHKEMTVPKVDQIYYSIKSYMKTEVLARVIDIMNPKLTVVFCNTKKRVDQLTTELQAKGFFADGLHGDLKQSSRDTVMNKFRKGTIDILVATDVAARGIDVDDVDLVINYDLPQNSEYYVHRIGRTARAGRTGTAISFVTSKDIYNLRDIQKYTKTKIIRKSIPSLKDLEENQTSKILEVLRTEIEKNDFNKESKIIDMLIGEQYDAYDIACSVLKLYNLNNREYKSDSSTDFKDDEKSFSSRKNSNHSEKKNTDRIYINIGKRKGVSQRHILSAIVKDAGIDAKKVGKIDIYDKFTFVDMDKNISGKMVENLNDKYIKGFKVSVEYANEKDN